MALPTFTMRQLLEAGVHFGHTTRRWNPKMEPFIYGERNDIHILDLQQTVPLLSRSLEAVRNVVANGGRVLMVGTKRQASEYVAEAAARCGQYYVNHRWLGGMLTNWKTISHSIKRLRQVQEILDEGGAGLTKKETLNLTRERDKLERALGGIKDMGGLPDLIFIIDTNKEHLAISEANKLGIPVAAVLDSNSDPYGITYPIPGNDDALRAISLYCELVGDAVLDGISAEMQGSGEDPGAAAHAGEKIPEEAEMAEAAGEGASQGADTQGAESPSGESASGESGGGESAQETTESQAKSA
ncbi:MAG: 30S ribosomal protein S2 [Rhodovibrio sp.]|nr:30S ribosomal protein S2 [Rhodovibrio sp.]